jgi:hypothetical protein
MDDPFSIVKLPLWRLPPNIGSVKYYVFIRSLMIDEKEGEEDGMK